jgi:hypothetical protein
MSREEALARAPNATMLSPANNMIMPPIMFNIAIMVTPVGLGANVMMSSMHIFGFKGNSHCHCDFLQC